MSARRARLACAAIVASLVVGGCYREYTLVDPPRSDAGPRADASARAPGDAGASDAGWSGPIGACTSPAPIDLLFVIDSSATMAGAQEIFVAQLPRLIADLVRPPDADGDGAPDWPALSDLQVGIVTADMGSAGHLVPNCGNGASGYDFGDDGLLGRTGPWAPGCSGTPPDVFRFTGGDPVAFADDVACVALVGTNGCGFEQPLEAALKALSPSRPAPYTRPDYAPPTFFRGTTGHGDGANHGFVREQSVLAVVIVTDEDDCSVADPALLERTSGPYAAVDLNLRCHTFPDALHPAARYVDGLLALRAHRPDLFALAVIAGIPVEAAVEHPSAAELAAILDHPAMVERIDPTMPGRLLPACDAPGRGGAYPARRLVQVAAGLGEGRSTVQSICHEDLSPAVAALTSLVVRRACGARETL